MLTGHEHIPDERKEDIFLRRSCTTQPVNSSMWQSYLLLLARMLFAQSAGQRKRTMAKEDHLIHYCRMERNQQMHRQAALMRQSLFDQGSLDEQFIQLEELQDDANPNFVEEVVTLYYRDSSRLIHAIDQALGKGPLDFERLDNYMHQFKGSSSSIGAKKVKAECTQFREYCRAGSAEGCTRTFQQLKSEYATLRKKLEAYFQLARQAGPRESACRRR